jgi:hypothetical protein
MSCDVGKKMKIFLVVLWLVSSAALFLVADFEVGWFQVLRIFSPGFEWSMVLPGLCFAGGLLSTLFAMLLTVVILKREKKKIWPSPPFVWNSILLFCYVALVVFSVTRHPCW